MKKEWREVKNFPSYKVSNQGEVFNIKFNRLLKSYPLKKYLQVGLYLNGKRTKFLTHKLVASSFLGDCPEGKEVNHKDGNTRNNLLDNLEYLTSSENKIHSYQLGIHNKQGSRHHFASLNESQVRLIKIRLKNGERICDLAREFEVSYRTIQFIKSGKNWKHVLIEGENK